MWFSQNSQAPPLYAHAHASSQHTCPRDSGVNTDPHSLHSRFWSRHACGQPVSWQITPLIRNSSHESQLRVVLFVRFMSHLLSAPRPVALRSTLILGEMTVSRNYLFGF
jgi:hypothetical protein